MESQCIDKIIFLHPKIFTMSLIEFEREAVCQTPYIPNS